MKRNIFKLFISFLFVFVIIGNVNAKVLECGPDSEVATIVETGITQAGFDVKVPICKFDTSRGPSGWQGVGTGSSYQSTYDSGLDLVTRYFESADAKGTVLASVPVCSSDLRYVTFSAECTATKDPSYTAALVCAGRSQSSCNATSGCTWVSTMSNDIAKPVIDGPGDGTCTGGHSAYYECPSGYSPAGHQSSKPICKKEFNIEPRTVTADVNAVSECESETGGKCTCSTQEYTLVCPTYSCIKEYKNIGACTPDFKVDGEPAYCVNPSQGFNHGSGNYQVDESFDVRKCESSFSTVDCGYANILIEGAYYNTSDDAINLALRLWSVHAGQAGFDRTGLANRIVGSDGKCSEAIYYMQEGGGYINVYKYTHDYIMEKFYDIAKQKDYIPDYINDQIKTMTGQTFQKISCDHSNTAALIGVACGDNPTYRIAFELFFNTVIGNKHMQDHLDSLYNVGPGIKPIGAQLVEITEEEHTSETDTWVEVTYEREDFEKIFGDEEVIDCKKLDKSNPHYDQIRPYCKTHTRIVDAAGNVVDEGDMDYCIKNSGCRRVTTIESVCSPVTEGYKITKIEVTYERDDSSYSIRRYVSCSNPGVNQILFAYFDEDEDGSSGGTGGTVTDTNTTTDTFYVTNYICENGCNNYSLRGEANNVCSTDDNNYNGTYGSTVKDPSLSCIVNMESPSEKLVYDYSNLFGVNTNFCRIYCSDEVEYHIADKVRSTSGRPFIYDIRTAVANSNDDNKLTTIVKEKRSCTSEIYFDSLPKEVDWKRIYGLSDSEMPSVLSWTNLFNALVKKAKSEGGRTENLNQMIYDLYNCNLYAQKTFDDRGITQPRDNTVGNVLNKIKTIYSEANNYGIVGNSTDTVAFNFGARIEGTTDSRVGLNANSIKAASNFSGTMSAVRYCTDKTGVLCYQYNSENESYDYGNINSTNVEEPLTIKAGDTRIKLNNKVGSEIKIPTNDYSYFEVITQVNFFNNEMYQTVENTGYIVPGTGRDDLLTLEKYSYPVDKYAYNLDVCNVKLKDGSEEVKGCPITQTVSVATFNRNGFTDRLTAALKSNNKFSCYVSVEEPTTITNKSTPGKQSRYRNVDVSNLFPNEIIPANWNTPEGQAAKKQIEETSSLLTTTNDLLEYSVTLNPTQIKAVKYYNQTHGSYVDEPLSDCDIVDDIYMNCRSYFMNSMRGYNTEYPIGTLGNINPDYQSGESAYNATH